MFKRMYTTSWSAYMWQWAHWVRGYPNLFDRSPLNFETCRPSCHGELFVIPVLSSRLANIQNISDIAFKLFNNKTMRILWLSKNEKPKLIASWIKKKKKRWMWIQWKYSVVMQHVVVFCIDCPQTVSKYSVTAVACQWRVVLCSYVWIHIILPGLLQLCAILFSVMLSSIVRLTETCTLTLAASSFFFRAR